MHKKIGLTANHKINNLFNVASIIFNYICNITPKDCTTLNHRVLGHLGPLLLDYIFEAIDVDVGGFVNYVHLNTPHDAIWQVHIQDGGGDKNHQN